MAQDQFSIRNQLLVAQVPAMPQVLLKLLELCRSEEVSILELSKLIASDAGMAVKVLNVANRAAYHGEQRNLSLLQALNKLGTNLTKTLVISESVIQTFSKFPHATSSDLSHFWKHALMTALISQEIARVIDYPNVEEAYLAGLLHDVGRIALLAAAPQAYRAFFTSQDDEHLCEIEQTNLRISHCEAGAWLVEQWDFDYFLADSILYHHLPEAMVKTAHPLVRIIHLGQTLSSQVEADSYPADMGDLCNLSNDQLQQIHLSVVSKVEEFAEQFGIDISDGQEAVASPKPVETLDRGDQRLTNEIFNIALGSELAQSFARQTGKPQLIEAIRQNAQLIFNLDELALFFLEENAEELVGIAWDANGQSSKEYTLQLPHNSAVAQSFLQKTILFVGIDTQAVTSTEEVLLSALSSEFLVCVPIVNNSKSLGLLVAGIPFLRLVDLAEKESLLLEFGKQAGLSLEATSKKSGEIEHRIHGIRQQHREESRRIAHEVNNPLTIIKSYLDVLGEKNARHETVSGELSILNNEIDRVGNIIDNFAAQAPRRSAAISDVNRAVRNTVELFQRSKFLPPNVHLFGRLTDAPAFIDGEVGLLNQVLVNLIKNAIEALPKGGRIDVVNNGVNCTHGQWLQELLIKDSGSGIAADVLENLFSPVPSSKDGHNRGIGLSIVHECVKKLKGCISCQSGPAGTTFHLLLPAFHPEEILDKQSQFSVGHAA